MSELSNVSGLSDTTVMCELTFKTNLGWSQMKEMVLDVAAHVADDSKTR